MSNYTTAEADIIVRLFSNSLDDEAKDLLRSLCLEFELYPESFLSDKFVETLQINDRLLEESRILDPDRIKRELNQEFLVQIHIKQRRRPRKLPQVEKLF